MNPINSVLVTGGTGTFGQAFVKFLLTVPAIERIVVYSRGEHSQATFRQSIADTESARHGLERIRWMLGDVRDVKRLERAFTGCDSVVHAAALKRIETGHYNPDEMVKTNVFGAMNVVEAACRASVSRVVALSSDKAYQPVSPYGASKALAEALFLGANDMHGEHGPAFAVTRYGNIWNAQGSVVPLWKSRLANGLLPKVTDPECTRFFMTIEEAILLVWNTLQDVDKCKLVIPTGLPAYRLHDLATAFGLSEEDMTKCTGLPQWEKLHESMSPELCSVDARRMTVDELRGWLSVEPGIPLAFPAERGGGGLLTLAENEKPPQSTSKNLEIWKK